MERKINKPSLIIVHHTAVSRKKAPRQFFAVDQYHKDSPNINLGYPSTLGYYGGYHIFIEPNGAEFRYREDWEEGAHCIGQNLNSLGVCFAGNGDIEFPTSEQNKTLAERIKKWQAQYGIPNDAVHIVPHRKFANKSCYGNLLSNDWAYLLANPAEPDPADAEKAAKIEKMVKLVDLLKELILKLTIFLNLTAARQKTPPQQ